ncbi:hypothetical protein [Massilia cavernae]|uniref:Pilus assembly protein n=1 Tax=Massilia cavernae TaxID=2320864 RepID=A0A418XXW6_9BURK|nr:hypothetical protein [Massilia cavernae]RJG17811.1 hypothetical protein D3872_10090 [Massilia cavernae]
MKPHLTVPSLLALAACLAGCAHERPVGASVSLAMAQQVIDPLAGSNRDPVKGIDGQAAKSSYDAYQKSYRSPQPQPNVFTIGIGGAR